MTAMDDPRHRPASEQLIAPLLPSMPSWPTPVPAPLPVLPSLPVSLDGLVIDMASPDTSGRISARRALTALNWASGHRVDVAVVAGLLVIGSAADGQYVVAPRGMIKLPAAARRLVGIAPGDAVLLAACPTADVLVAHPPGMVAGWLRREFADRSGAR
jgi:hypothetical protein